MRDPRRAERKKICTIARSARVKIRICIERMTWKSALSSCEVSSRVISRGSMVHINRRGMTVMFNEVNFIFPADAVN